MTGTRLLPGRGVQATLLLSLALFLLSSCERHGASPGDGASEAMGKTGEAGHAGHDHAAGERCAAPAEEHGDACVMIDIGEHAFLGELDLDREHAIVELTVLDHAERKAHPHEGQQVTLNIRTAEGPRQVKMAPAPLETDPAGKTSRYRAADPVFGKVEKLDGRVNLTIDGKSYVCDLAGTH